MSRLVEFYKGHALDTSGRSLDDLLAFSDGECEAVHDFIQWLFPLPERSAYNPSAPLLTNADIAAFRADPDLRANLRRSFDRFLAFLGLSYEDSKVERAADFDRKSVVWKFPNHNWLRVTRVLTSTRLLGLEAETRAFFEFLDGLRSGGRSGITDDTFRYWQRAAAPPD